MYILTDMSEESINDFKMQNKHSICFGCGCQIYDQFILKVAPDLEWHANCLKCYECNQYLDENCTCFVRSGKAYCKNDYFKLFSRRCSNCKECFNKNDFVMRANNKIYHTDCFRCTICSKKLTPGDEYSLREDGLYCKADSADLKSHPTNSTNTSNTCQNITNMPLNSNKLLIKCEDIHIQQNEFNENPNCSLSPHQQSLHSNIHHSNLPIDINSNNQQSIPFNHNINPIIQHQHQQQQHQQQQQHHIIINNNSTSRSTAQSSNSSNSNRDNHHIHHRKDKTTRVRTVLNEKQLHTLRACYGANPRPDALMKEQLVEMTGLSPRVIRVWFQNKRCKDKKKSILIKQMQEQQKSRQSIGHGIPMVATSPIQNDLSNLSSTNQVEIQTSSNIYQNNNLSWKSEYNIGPEIGNLMNGRLNNNNSLVLTNLHKNAYHDEMMGFASDEEDCFDNLSDQGGNEDSLSSVGLDETRIQQL